MGFFDKKSTKNTTNNETNIDDSLTAVDNSSIGDASNVNKITAENISGDVVMTDYGAIEQATGLAKGALDFSSNTLANAFQFGDSQVTKSLLFGESALQLADNVNKMNQEFGMSAVDSVVEATKNSLNFGNSALENSLNFGNDALEKATSLGKDALSSATAAANFAVNKVSDVVKAANTSDSVQTIKYIMLGVAVVAALIFVAPKLFSKGE